MRENQVSRLKVMIAQLLPSTVLRGGRDNSISSRSSSDFEEFIYNPLRSATPRYRLSRDISGGQEVFPVRVYSDTGNCVPPEEFTYISSCDFSMFKENRVSKRVKCDCDDLICGELCSCREINDRLTFCTIMGDGRVFVNSNATFFNTLIVGCGSKCVCKGQCRNSLRSTSLPAPFRFEVFRRSDDLGFGLRTLSNIPQGCAVVEFCGEVVGSKVLSSRGAESLDYSFCLHSSEETEIYERLASARRIRSEAFSVLNDIAYIDPTRKGNIARFISSWMLPKLDYVKLFFDYGSNYLNRAGFKCECRTMWCDSVAARWRSAYPSHEEIMRKSQEYFSYLKQRMKVYDLKAKQYLRNEGIIRPEYDDLDEPCDGTKSKLSRIDPSCVHKRDGENEPVICYNLYCRNHAKCTCKPLVRVIPTITLD
ncbi:SET domain protein [Cooperia oncophora]